ncbi:MAG: DUF2130 domain-containing protein [Anaeroplasmataceae bacterium]|nr:DUF2130 domain-containing protein [Anaeroplasmataceae bacterium]
MKKIQVIVRDKNTLVLEEDATKGDYIDLTSISNVDFKQIENAVLAGKDAVYNKKLEEYKEMLMLQLNQEKKNLENGFAFDKQQFLHQIDSLKKENQQALENLKNSISNEYTLELEKKNFELKSLEAKYAQELETLKKSDEHKHALEIQALTTRLEQEKQASIQKENETSSKHQLEIMDLQSKLSALQSQVEMRLSNERLETEKKYIDQMNLLNQQLKDASSRHERFELEQKLKLEEQLRKQEQIFAEERLQYKEQIELLNQQYQLLQRQKASLNVKQTGEDLESWCDNEVKSYMQNGLLNCSWEKDNQVVRNEDEAKGSKADYIFSIFASNQKDVLLAKVCLDMKDENPDSVNRKKNADYYKALDNNRKKKDCKYAVLVSNLELDKPNDIPIYKVSEYEEMYVVRPAYLMTFLNMLVSLTTRFADIVLAKEEERLEIKNLLDLKASFEDLKKTYLDKPLESLEKNIDEIRSQNSKIMDASKKIEGYCDAITRTYLNEIQNKLDRFDIKVTKIYK